MRKVAVHYCKERNLFHLQFGVGCFFLCHHQMTRLLHSIRETEADTFTQAYICALNAFEIDYTSGLLPEIQLSFGNIVVRMNRKELLYFLTLLWENFTHLMERISSYFSEEPPKLILV